MGESIIFVCNFVSIIYFACLYVTFKVSKGIRYNTEYLERREIKILLNDFFRSIQRAFLHVYRRTDKVIYKNILQTNHP